MNKVLKKYLSFFFLFLFLFPMAEKQMHTFIHQDDTHCSATDKHFHELEHNCSICDFTSTDSAPGTENIFSLSIAEANYSYNTFRESVHSRNPLHHLPSRAPPVV